MGHDLRTQAMDEDPDWRDSSQRMLNVMMADTVIPIHRHTASSETIIVLRGSGDEVTYDDTGKETMRVTLRAGTDCVAVQVPRNVYHTFIPHEDGTTIFEAKDRAYDPDSTISL
jgi:cupin fold WbuC family metalloprotein